MEKIFTIKLIDELILNKFITKKIGVFIFEFILIKEIEQNYYYTLELVLNKMLNDFNNKKYMINEIMINDIITRLDSLSENINYKMYLNINYLDNKVINNKNLFIIDNDYKVDTALNILSINKKSVLDLSQTFVDSDKLVFVNKSNLPHYIQLYVNNNINNFEKNYINEDVPILCFNNKYIIDGNYRYFLKHIQNNMNRDTISRINELDDTFILNENKFINKDTKFGKKIKIFNLFNTNNHNKYLNYLNSLEPAYQNKYSDIDTLYYNNRTIPYEIIKLAKQIKIRV